MLGKLFNAFIPKHTFKYSINYYSDNTCEIDITVFNVKRNFLIKVIEFFSKKYNANISEHDISILNDNEAYINKLNEFNVANDFVHEINKKVKYKILAAKIKSIRFEKNEEDNYNIYLKLEGLWHG